MDSRIYCLPDNYEVHDNSLNDIKQSLRPHFHDLDNLDVIIKTLDGKEFIPGYVGLNNQKSSDYLNVVI